MRAVPNPLLQRQVLWLQTANGRSPAFCRRSNCSRFRSLGHFVDQLRLSRNPVIESLPILASTRQIQFVCSLLNLLMGWDFLPVAGSSSPPSAAEQVDICPQFGEWITRGI